VRRVHTLLTRKATVARLMRKKKRRPFRMAKGSSGGRKKTMGVESSRYCCWGRMNGREGERGREVGDEERDSSTRVRAWRTKHSIAVQVLCSVGMRNSRTQATDRREVGWANE
jgi:hypothetical protein